MPPFHWRSAERRRRSLQVEQRRHECKGLARPSALAATVPWVLSARILNEHLIYLSASLTILRAANRLTPKRSSLFILHFGSKFAMLMVGVVVHGVSKTLILAVDLSSPPRGRNQPLTGTAANGSFDEVIPSVLPSFDPVGGGAAVSGTAPLTVAYDETIANTGFFMFQQGPVFSACFGTRPMPGESGWGRRRSLPRRLKRHRGLSTW